MDVIFNKPADGLFPLGNAYSLGTLLRALQYPSLDYVTAWRDATGFASVTKVSSVNPPPYCVAYHADGLVVAFDGLHNLAQFISLYSNSSQCEMFNCPGAVMWYLRQAWEAIYTDLFALINAAPNKNNIVVTGFSAGGALAYVALRQLATIYGPSAVKYGVTFGAPRPGNRDFAAAFPVPVLAVENFHDAVPGFPLNDSYIGAAIVGTMSSDGYAMPGHVLEFSEAANVRSVRSRRFLPADPLILANSIVSYGSDPLGSPHALKTYMGNFAPNVNRGAAQSREALMYQLNRCMDFNVAPPPDFSTPVAPPVTTAAATPPTPTVAALQAPPTTAGGPSSPPPVYNTALVGATQRVHSIAVVTTQPDTSLPKDFHGKDRRMLERLQLRLDHVGRRDLAFSKGKKSHLMGNLRGKALVTALRISLDEVANRDARNADPKKSRKLSTRKYVIDPEDAGLDAAFDAVRDRCNAYLANYQNETVFCNGGGALKIAFDNLYFHLVDLLYFT